MLTSLLAMLTSLLAVFCLSVVLNTIGSAGKFQVPPNEKPQNIFNGHPFYLESGFNLLERTSDIVFRIYAPFHTETTPLPQQRCVNVDTRRAVAIAEAVSLAFELLNEARRSIGVPAKRTLGFSLYDTCASVPVYLYHNDGLWGMHEPSAASEASRDTRERIRCECSASKDTMRLGVGDVESVLARCQPPTAGFAAIASAVVGLSTHGRAAETLEGSGESSGQQSSPAPPALTASSSPIPAASTASGRTRKGRAAAGLGGDDPTERKAYPRLAIGPFSANVARAVSPYLHHMHPSVLHVIPTAATFSGGPGEDDDVVSRKEQQLHSPISLLPGIRQHADALLEASKAFGWSHVSMLAAETPSDQELKTIIQSRAIANKLCLAMEGSIEQDTERSLNASVLSFLSSLAQIRSLGAVILLADEATTVQVMNIWKSVVSHTRAQGRSRLRAWTWIGFQDWDYVAGILRDTWGPGSEPPDSIRISPTLPSPPVAVGKQWHEIKDALHRRLVAIKPTHAAIVRNPWIALVWEEVHQCRLLCAASYRSANESDSPCTDQLGQFFAPSRWFAARHVRSLKWTTNCTALESLPSLARQTDTALLLMNTIFQVSAHSAALVQDALRQCRSAPIRLAFPRDETTRFLSVGLTSEIFCSGLEAWHHKSAAQLPDFYSQSDFHSQSDFYQDLEVIVLNARAFHKRLRQGSSRLQGLQSKLTVSRLGNNWQLTAIGESTSQRFQLYGHVATDKLLVSNCSVQCPGGHQRRQPDFLRSCCFLCERCEAGKVSDVDSPHCELCPLGQHANAGQTSCVPYRLDYARWYDGALLVALVGSLLGAAATVATMIAFCVHRKSPAVKSADVPMSIILLTALLLSFACVLVLLWPPTDTVCALHQLLVPVWPVVYVTCLAVKTNRLRVVFRHTSHRLPPGNLHLMSTPVQLMVLAAVLFVTAAFFSVWGYYSAPRAVVVATELGRTLECRLDTAYMIAYFLWVLMLIASTTLLAFFTRRLPEYFNEAMYLAIASAVVLLWWVILVPVYFGSRRMAPTTTLACIMLAQGVSILAALFARRLYFIARPSDKLALQLFGVSFSSSSDGQGCGAPLSPPGVVFTPQPTVPPKLGTLY